LNHLQEPLWPRTVSTKATYNKQVVVYSKEDALTRFRQSNYEDCRISAYPPDESVTPRRLIIMIDLDQSNFKNNKKDLDLALKNTLQNIRNYWSDVIPTVIWSGRGYHIYLVMDSENIVLERITDFTDKLRIDRSILSVTFLRFAESELSAGKSDKSHNTTVSFNNCMLRIPESINSKNNVEVKIYKCGIMFVLH
jgi:hypothetical protein